MSILTTLKEQLTKEPLLSASHIVVAYSGGVDSQVLLHGINQLKQDLQRDFILSAIHIHHGLSQHADQWQSHCQQECDSLGVNFLTEKVFVKSTPRQSLEAQAREARYNKLFELAPSGSCVLLGQHQDDQLETFLLQLKRGAGPKGLSAMARTWETKSGQESNSKSQKSVIFHRPLLDMSRKDILGYAGSHKLNWCEDESNLNIEFERNFLRRDVLPIMLQRWPELASTVSRSAMLCSQQQTLLEESCEEKLAEIEASDKSLYIPKLQELSQAWMHQVVRYWLAKKSIQSPSLAVLNLLNSDVFDADEDANPVLQWQNWQFRRFNKQLFVMAKPSPKIEFSILWQGEKQIDMPKQLGSLLFLESSNSDHQLDSGVRFDPRKGPITIRTGGYSVKFKPTGSLHSKPVKQWFKEWKVAPWLRGSVVLIIQNDVVLSLFCEGKWQHSEQANNTPDSMVILHIQS